MTTQALQALQIANNHRLTTARLRRDVAADKITVAAALNDPACANQRVAAVLAWQHRWSDHRAERFLVNNEICSPFLEAKDLTDRQRALIARELRVKGIAA